jgi:hypothetical protein
LGEVDENKINNMAYIWFNSVLEALGKRINYESISNIYGNSFAKDSAKIVQAANPLLKNGGQQNTGIMGLTGQIKIVEAKSKEASKQALNKQLGDFSWAEGLPI